MNRHPCPNPLRPPSEDGGFSLMELIVTVAVLAIVLGIAAPAMSGYVSNAKLTEAKENLKILAGLSERYRQDNGVYPTTMSTTDTQAVLPTWSPSGTLLFGYTIVGAATTYTITATAIDGNGIDGHAFTLNQSNTRQHTINGSISTW